VRVQSVSGNVAVQRDLHSCGVWVMLMGYLTAFAGVACARAAVSIFGAVIDRVRQLCAKSVVENSIRPLELVVRAFSFPVG
jgi:hypothetical protein